MERSEADVRAIAERIVTKSKNTAHVDTGRLKRSIYYVIDERGKLEFGEVFYGQFKNSEGEYNSDLEENINDMLPKDIPYNLIYKDDEGNEYVAIKRLGSGRKIETKTIKPEKSKSKGIGGIRDFLKKLTDAKTKEDTGAIERAGNSEKKT